MRIYTGHFILPKVKSFFCMWGATYMWSTYKCMHVRSKLMWGVFLNPSPFSFLQSLTFVTSLSIRLISKIPFFSQGLESQEGPPCLLALRGCWGSNSSSHAYMVNALSTKPSPQPLKSLSNLEPFMIILSHILHEEQNTWKMGGRHGKLTMAITRKQKEVLHISYFISVIFSQN